MTSNPFHFIRGKMSLTFPVSLSLFLSPSLPEMQQKSWKTVRVMGDTYFDTLISSTQPSNTGSNMLKTDLRICSRWRKYSTLSPST